MFWFDLSIVLALTYLGYAPDWVWTVRWCHVTAHRQSNVTERAVCHAELK